MLCSPWGAYRGANRLAPAMSAGHHPVDRQVRGEPWKDDEPQQRRYGQGQEDRACELARDAAGEVPPEPCVHVLSPRSSCRYGWSALSRASSEPNTMMRWVPVQGGSQVT